MKERVLTRVVEYPDNFSEHAKSLCQGLLAKQVDERLAFKNGCCDEIRAHPFFKDINWRKLNAGIVLLYLLQYIYPILLDRNCAFFFFNFCIIFRPF